MNTEEFIKKSKAKYGDERFDYSETEYVNKRTKVKIICKKHGPFETYPCTHLKGAGGCKMCSGRQDINTEKFIKLSRGIHGNKYDYSKVNYKNNYTKVKIICPLHGEFEQLPKQHLRGCGCKKCSVRTPLDIFIKKAKAMHDRDYNYSQVQYIKGNLPVKIICPIHGSFLQTPDHHLKGCDCPLCAREKASKKRIITTEEFVRRAKLVHGDKYDYSMSHYEKSDKEIIIICSVHGQFLQKPVSHLQGHGCPICKNTKGELAIIEILSRKDIKFVSEKIIHHDDNTWSIIDFEISSGLIEFDGLQHFKSIDFFGGEESLIDNIKRDKKKNVYCKENNIPLLRIRYDQIDDIEAILEHFISNPNFYKDRYNPYLTNEEYYSIREAV